MRIERTPGIESPSRTDIVRSGLNEHFSAVSRDAIPERSGYLGGEPTKRLGGKPKGWLLVMEQGLIFLAKGEKNPSADTFLEALAEEAANQTLAIIDSLARKAASIAEDDASRVDEML